MSVTRSVISGGRVLRPGSYILVDTGEDLRKNFYPQAQHYIGLGTLVDRVLKFFGITVARWLWIKSWFVDKPTCGCAGRLASWNRIQIIRPIKWLRWKLRGSPKHSCSKGSPSKDLSRIKVKHRCSSSGRDEWVLPGKECRHCGLNT